MADALTPLPGELVTLPEATERLLDMARSAAVHERPALREILQKCGCREPDGVLEELRAGGFFLSRPPGLALSSRGYRALLFVSGALGRGSDDVFNELRNVEPGLRRYELVREGMTARF